MVAVRRLIWRSCNSFFILTRPITLSNLFHPFSDSDEPAIADIPLDDNSPMEEEYVYEDAAPQQTEEDAEDIEEE